MATTNHPVTTQSSSPKPSEHFLVTSVQFWFAISLASSTFALAFFSETDFYNTNFSRFGNPTLCLLSSTLTALHFVLFLSHKRLRRSRLLHGATRESFLAVAVPVATGVLHLVPENSVAGLFFVMCCWIDSLAIVMIARPWNDFRLMHLIYLAIVNRAISLYGFTGRMWLIQSFCSLVLPVRYWLEDAVAGTQEAVGVAEKNA